MLFPHAVDQLFRRQAFGFGAQHHRRAVGVVGADVMDFHGGPVVIHLHALKTHPDIGLDVLNEMAQMYGAIGIGQCGGDEDATMRHGCDRVKEGSE